MSQKANASHNATDGSIEKSQHVAFFKNTRNDSSEVAKTVPSENSTEMINSNQTIIDCLPESTKTLPFNYHFVLENQKLKRELDEKIEKKKILL